MKLGVRNRPDSVSDSTPMVWVLAGLFAIVAGAFLALAVQETARGKVGLPVAAAMAVGFIGLVAATFAAGQAERRTLSVDRLRRTVHLSGRLPWRRRGTSWKRGDISGVEIEQDEDSDGDPIWRTTLVLGSGERVPLMACWRHDRDYCERLLEQTRQLLGS